MTMRPRPATTLRLALTVAIVPFVQAIGPGWTRANQAAEPPPPPPPPPGIEAAPAPAVPMTEVAAAPAPEQIRAAPPAAGRRMTDHDEVVGHWGIEVRQLGSFAKTPGQDMGCAAPCEVPMNAFSVRKWTSPHYAWSAGLALGLGGGSSKVGGKTGTWDTYFGIGPTVAASFLLGNWKHLAVSASPQLDFVFFMPGGSRSKTATIDARGLIEGELHLGFMGLAPISLGVSSGLDFRFTGITKAGSETNVSKTATSWSLGLTGPQTLWGLVTNMFIRFYL